MDNFPQYIPRTRLSSYLFIPRFLHKSIAPIQKTDIKWIGTVNFTCQWAYFRFDEARKHEYRYSNENLCLQTIHTSYEEHIHHLNLFQFSFTWWVILSLIYILLPSVSFPSKKNVTRKAVVPIDPARRNKPCQPNTLWRPIATNPPLIAAVATAMKRKPILIAI